MLNSRFYDRNYTQEIIESVFNEIKKVSREKYLNDIENKKYYEN